MLGVWVALTASAADGCTVVTTVADFDAARATFYAAWKRLDEQASHAAAGRVDESVRCIQAPLAAPEIVQLFQVRGLGAFLAGDMTAVRTSFRAAVAILPDYGLPSTVAAPGDDWYEMYEALRAMPPEPRQMLPAPDGGWLQIDGARSMDAPLGRAWLFQRFDGNGSVVDTQVIEPGQTPPTYPVSTGPAPVDRRDRGPKSSTLLVAGLATAAVGAASMGAAASLRSRYRDTPTAEDATGLVGPNAALGVLGWSAVGAGGALVAGAVVTGRW